MSEPIPVIPTLHNISTPVLRNLGDQVAYIIRWYFANPGGTSSNNEGEIISFRKLNSMYGNNPSTMCEQTENMLRAICRRFATGLIVEVSYKDEIRRSSDDIDPVTGIGVLQGTYKMEISVTDQYGIPVVPHSTVRILNNGDTIDLAFDQRG